MRQRLCKSVAVYGRASIHEILFTLMQSRGERLELDDTIQFHCISLTVSYFTCISEWFARTDAAYLQPGRDRFQAIVYPTFWSNWIKKHAEMSGRVT